MSAALKDVVEADQIRMYISIRMIDAVADTGLSRKIDQSPVQKAQE